MRCTVKNPRREHLEGYVNELLFEYWPATMKKLGLDIEAYDYPQIQFCKGDSHFDPHKDNSICLNYKIVRKAYHEKDFELQGMKIDYEEMLLEDIVHETVHYVQENFYSVHESGYNCTIEGMATAISLKVLIDGKKYKIPAAKIADMHKKVGAKYKKCFDIPKKYEKHIRKIIKSDMKPKSLKEYAAGFIYICKYYPTSNEHLLELLITPFEDEECFEEFKILN